MSVHYLPSSDTTLCDVCEGQRVVGFLGHLLCGSCFGILCSLAARQGDGVLTDLNLWIAYEKTVMLRGNVRGLSGIRFSGDEPQPQPHVYLADTESHSPPAPAESMG